MLDLVRLSETIASSETMEAFLDDSNSLFDALSAQDRLDDIEDLNSIWMNTDNIDSPFVKARMENEVALYLADQQINSPDLFGEIFLTNKYGLAIATTGKLTTLSHLNKYWWQGAYDNGDGAIFIDDRGFDESVSGYVLGIVIPIYDDADQIIGILKSNYNISLIFEDTVSFFHDLKSDGEFYIVRTQGLIINGDGLVPLSESVDSSLIPFLERNKDINMEHKINKTNYLVSISQVEITFDSDETVFWSSYDSGDHTLGNQGKSWSVVYLVEKDLILNRANSVSKTIAYGGLIGVDKCFPL